MASLLAHALLVGLTSAPLAGKPRDAGAEAPRRVLQVGLRAPGVAAGASAMPETSQAAPAAGRQAVRDMVQEIPPPPVQAAESARTAALGPHDAPPVPADVTTTPLLIEGLPAPRYYLPREVDQAAAPLEHAHLIYPEDALRKRIGGVVVMHLFIGPDGRLERTEVVRAEPPGVFEDAVRAAAAASRFRAALLGQRPVSSRVTIEVPFNPNCGDFQTCAAP